MCDSVCGCTTLSQVLVSRSAAGLAVTQELVTKVATQRGVLAGHPL
jgi:hypothetical protein